ncbi:hypothetical protein CPter291_4343 [Collimonas pratensis]|uniref:Uncharacterized protein n=1 Tax=Collimonas pratensis TaxID=279113 RepID=A0ABM5ZC06_9BURK|nr:hypothetical protein CPter291_4343 [Collimonas pratensis]
MTIENARIRGGEDAIGGLTRKYCREDMWKKKFDPVRISMPIQIFS